jgi:hypothetical protein
MHASKENLSCFGGTNPQNNYTSLNMNTTDFLKNVLKQCLNSTPTAHKQKAHLKGLNGEKEIIILGCILLLHTIYIYTLEQRGYQPQFSGTDLFILNLSDFLQPLDENVSDKHYSITFFKSLLLIQFITTFISNFSGI